MRLIKYIKLNKILIFAIFTLCVMSVLNPVQAQNKVFSVNNPISLAISESTINKGAAYIRGKRYEEAKNILKPIVNWLENSTEYHASLYQTLKEIESAKAQADIERELALKSAMLRDKGYYQLGLLCIIQNNPKSAVDYLVKVVKSQPKTDEGFKAYEKLQELGFTYKAQLQQINKDGQNEQN